MHAKAKPETESVIVAKEDLVNAWLVLEKLVVSLRKIGSAHAVSTPGELTPEVERQMFLEIGKFVSENVFDDANRFRIPLGDYLPDEEAESLADQLEYWKPQTTQNQKIN